jgi:hypothetical protein
MVLSKMKETAEAYLGHKVTHAVVTVPACKFDACSHMQHLADIQTSTTLSDPLPRTLEPSPVLPSSELSMSPPPPLSVSLIYTLQNHVLTSSLRP